ASLDAVTRYLDAGRARGVLPSAVLVDAHVEGQHGGTGRGAPWELLADFRPGVPLILAGGLTAENVAEAVGVGGPGRAGAGRGVGGGGAGREGGEKGGGVRGEGGGGGGGQGGESPWGGGGANPQNLLLVSRPRRRIGRRGRRGGRPRPEDRRSWPPPPRS